MLLMLILVHFSPELRAQAHPANGLVLEVDSAHRSILVSCAPIPGYMPAMEMPLKVRDAKTIATLKAGTTIHFNLVEHGTTALAERIEPVVNFEPEPLEAGALTALDAAVDGSAATKRVELGGTVPDFTLIDQLGHAVSLSQFRGKVIAVTFGYSRCPNPNYCLRLSRNLAAVEGRFHERAGRDLILITIAIDPEYDKGPALARYARSFSADANNWHFLTGSVAQIHQVAGVFGMNFWSTEGLLTHTLHTIVLDRKGRLAANIEGNQFSARQLGDLIQVLMNSPA